jgi:hypothetical protein
MGFSKGSPSSPIFFSLLNQIDQFFSHWTCKLEGYKCSLTVCK